MCSNLYVLCFQQLTTAPCNKYIISIQDTPLSAFDRVTNEQMMQGTPVFFYLGSFNIGVWMREGLLSVA